MRGFDGIRAIPDAFFTSRASFDGVDRDNETYIDCRQIVNSMPNGPKGICIGVSIDSTSDQATLGTLKVRLRSSNAKTNINLALGEVHELKLSRIYGDQNNSRGVKIFF